MAAQRKIKTREERELFDLNDGGKNKINPDERDAVGIISKRKRG